MKPSKIEAHLACLKRDFCTDMSIARCSGGTAMHVLVRFRRNEGHGRVPVGFFSL
ncbi:hypothetical protein HMPREF0972_00474 [Actinomyces sp. oral taxon 848 str. F0332]|nr:hypothetical protein HMPREF0972_00474 [Actinomyces sp. oral taxon 848 str. F0332]